MRIGGRAGFADARAVKYVFGSARLGPHFSHEQGVPHVDKARHQVNIAGPSDGKKDHNVGSAKRQGLAHGARGKSIVQALVV